MKRRNFISASALTFGTLMATMAAQATQSISKEIPEALNPTVPVDDGQFTNNDDDYANWETRNNGLTRFKSLMIEKGPGLEGTCRLIRFSEAAAKSGFKVPRHFHPEGEFTYVLVGAFEQLEKDKETNTYQYVTYKKGDTIWMPAKSIHEEARLFDQGVTILSFTPKNIKFSGF